MSRRGLLAVTDAALDRAKRKREGKSGAFEAPAPWSFPELPDTIRELLRGERETTSFYITSHPLDHIQLPKSDSTARVLEGVSGRWLSVSGVVSDSEVKTSRRGSLWARFTLEDLSGTCPVLAFGDAAKDVVDGGVVTVRGVVETRDESPVLKVTALRVLEEW